MAVPFEYEGGVELSHPAKIRAFVRVAVNHEASNIRDELRELETLRITVVDIYKTSLGEQAANQTQWLVKDAGCARGVGTPQNMCDWYGYPVVLGEGKAMEMCCRLLPFDDERLGHYKELTKASNKFLMYKAKKHSGAFQ